MVCGLTSRTLGNFICKKCKMKFPYITFYISNTLEVKVLNINDKVKDNLLKQQTQPFPQASLFTRLHPFEESL